MKLVRTGLIALVALTGATLSANAALLVCTGGPGMSIDTQVPDMFEVTFERAEQAANEVAPPPGKCAMPEVALPPGSSRTLSIPKKNKDALRLLAAARGGSFTVQVTGVEGKLLVSSIANIVINDGGGEAGGGGGGAGDVVEPDDGADDAGADDAGAGEDVGGGGEEFCGNPGDMSTVVIPEKDLHFLNIRTKPGGKVIGKVPEGRQVRLVGPCGTDAAAGIVAQKVTLKNAWCSIDLPKVGCVSARYLDVNAVGGAGIVADD